MLEKNSYRVAGYITAYNDLEALDNTVIALQQQTYPLEEIFIVDNSTTQLIVEERYKNATVSFHPENIGVGGGIKLAIKWAIQKGFDFIWLFDQDSQPESDVLEKLLLKYQDLSAKKSKIGILAPVILDLGTQQELPGCVFKEYKLVPLAGTSEIKDYYQCDGVITSGALVNLSAARCVELPKEELFLDAVDYAYCMNFRNKGYEIVIVKDTMMKHRIGNYCQVKDRFSQSGNEVITYICSPSRYYYSCRNHTFFETRTSLRGMLFRSILYRLKLSTKMIARIIRYEPDLVLLKIWACILGTYDGLLGKLGKSW